MAMDMQTYLCGAVRRAYLSFMVVPTVKLRWTMMMQIR